MQAATLKKPSVTSGTSRLTPSITLNGVITYALLIVTAVILVVPLLWAIAASFTPNDQVFEYAYPFSLRAFLPVDFTLEAYNNLFERGFWRAIVNTLALGASNVIIGGIICALAGFAFARFQFRGKRLLFTIVLITFAIPADLTAIPRYTLVSRLGWLNTWHGLLLPSLMNGLAIFVFRQFFEEIPQELIDAARVDGASWFRVFVSIVLPISKPVLISTGLILFLGQWDAFFWPLLVANRPEFRVVQVAITAAVQQYQTVWNELLAGSMLAAIIPILLMLPFQRYYVSAVLSSGLKE